MMFKTLIKMAARTSVVIFVLLALQQITFAQDPSSFEPAVDIQSKCTVNGQEVPCDQVTQELKGFLGLGIGIFILIVVLGIIATVFWIVMLVHAATHEIEHKAMWIILMVFTGIVGALVYYFVVKRKFNQQKLGIPTQI